MNNIYVLVGPRGTNKQLIAQELSRLYDISFIKPYTTRQPRFFNEPGLVFVTETTYASMNNSGSLIDLSMYLGTRYAVSYAACNAGGALLSTPSGVNALRSSKLLNRRVVSICIQTPVSIRIERLKARGLGSQEILDSVYADSLLFDNFTADAVVHNDDLLDLSLVVSEIYKTIQYYETNVK